MEQRSRKLKKNETEGSETQERRLLVGITNAASVVLMLEDHGYKGTPGYIKKRKQLIKDMKEYCK